MPPSTPRVTPYQISITSQRIDDLNTRLSNTKLPDELEFAEWDLGSPLSEIQRLTHYWRHTFSWRKAEERLNRLPHFTTTIQCDDFEPMAIHFLHKKSNVKNAIPLLFVHGWPGSFLEATKILEPLTLGDGEGHVAFDVVVPSLPNFGFSEGTKKRGFGIEQYAETLHKLMLRLGYEQYVTQGGDWGWYVTRAIANLYPTSCVATHLNMDVGNPPSPLTHPLLYLSQFTPATSQSRAAASRTAWFESDGFGYNTLQSTKPQTLGYGLTDSPAALLAWIYEKLHDWTDSYPWTDDEVCTWVSIYWFSTAGPAASCRIYYEMTNPRPYPPESTKQRLTRDKLKQYLPGVKVGQSHFPRDIHVLPREWTRTIGEVVFEAEHARGGHFAAWEEPEALVGDLRCMFGRAGGAEACVGGRDGYA